MRPDQRLQLVSARTFHEIVFTSGGTEADNFAIMGTAHANRSKGRILLRQKLNIMRCCILANSLRKKDLKSLIYLWMKQGVIRVEDVKKPCAKIRF